jgi:hypothetical protein
MKGRNSHPQHSSTHCWIPHHDTKGSQHTTTDMQEKHTAMAYSNKDITLKKSGIHIGRTTASSSNLLASCKFAISSQRMLGFFWTISFSVNKSSDFRFSKWWVWGFWPSELWCHVVQRELSLLPASAGFLLDLLFDSEEGNDILLWNARLSPTQHHNTEDRTPQIFIYYNNWKPWINSLCAIS